MSKIEQSGGFIFDNAPSKFFGTGIAPANNEIKDIMELIKSLENRGVLLKGTSTKSTSQEGGFLTFHRPLMIAGLLLIKSVLTLLVKRFVTIGLLAGMPSADAAIQKKIYGSGTTALILTISNEEINDIMKIVKSFKESDLLSGAIKNVAKEQKEGFLSMLLGILGASLLRNLLAGQGTIRAGEDIVRAGQDS